MATYSDALKEAYASVPTDTIIYSTLEIRHPDFEDEGGNNISIYLVRDSEDLKATLEEEHPLKPGQEVTFLSCPFDFVRPGKEPGVIPQLKLEIDNISGDINKYVELAVAEETPIKIIYREYLNKDLSAPETIPLEFEIYDCDLNPFVVSFTCKMSIFTEKAVPNIEYTSNLFPNLVQ